MTGLDRHGVNTSPANGRGSLRQVQPRYPWVFWGLIVQALGLGSIAVVMWHNARDQSLGGHVTAEMLKFAWRSELHTRTGLIVLIAGTVVYAAGCVVMARPFVSRPVMLFVSIPLAAVAGVLVLGVLAIVVAAVITSFADIWDFDFGGGTRRKNKRDDD